MEDGEWKMEERKREERVLLTSHISHLTFHFPCNISHPLLVYTSINLYIRAKKLGNGEKDNRAPGCKSDGYKQLEV
jgi:hypothetical protein